MPSPTYRAATPPHPCGHPQPSQEQDSWDPRTGDQDASWAGAAEDPAAHWEVADRPLISAPSPVHTGRQTGRQKTEVRGRGSHQRSGSCGRSSKQQRSWASVGRRTAVCRARLGTPPSLPRSPSPGLPHGEPLRRDLR